MSRHDDLNDEDDDDDPLAKRRRVLAQRSQRRVLAFGVVMLVSVTIFGIVAVVVVARSKSRQQAAVQDGSPLPGVKRDDPRPERQPDAIKPIFFCEITVAVEQKPFADRANGLVRLTHHDLTSLHRENELKFIDAYRGRRFYVVGRAADLSLSRETATLTLGYPGFRVSCECQLNDPLLAKIRTGPNGASVSMVLLEGTCQGPTSFENCRVVDFTN